MHRILCLAATLLTLLLSSVAPAQNADELTVEVIVFAWAERPSGQTADPAALPGPGQTLSSGSGPYTALGDSALTLRTAHERLAGAQQTTPLAHLAWRQTLSDSRWVQLTGEVEGLRLEGRARIQGSRNPEVVVELQLGDPAGQRWILRQQRSLRLGATEYLDHPALGVVVRTTPFASLVNDADL
ncbi:MAG: peptidoglycan binding protein CsiV [Xanthomonadales bacterium]|jgi:hypothetical protein|nr:peptidoglycan binding protein CsiV [Xanthomonadales bacterium]